MLTLFLLFAGDKSPLIKFYSLQFHESTNHAPVCFLVEKRKTGESLAAKVVSIS